MTKYYFSADLGATSGRTMIAAVGDGNINLEEMTRFSHPLIRVGKHYHWNLLHLYNEIVKGLREAASRGIAIESIGIDTWGVDMAFFGSDGTLLAAPISYRDPYTAGESDRFFEKVPREKVYGLTGIQVMDFNSLYQLNALSREGYSPLKAASRILFLPDALSYMLTGNAVTEYTIASTSNFLDPHTKQLSAELLEAAGVSADKFAPVVMPGTVIGALTPEVQALTGLGAVPVVAVAGHDTGSAVAAVPAVTENFAYLSSGTWSLMGIESSEPIINADSYEHNFTNEGGVGGTTTFLKNICGMWLLERCRAEWEECSYDQLISEAMECEPFKFIVNTDDPAFANPSSMTEAIARYCFEKGQGSPSRRGEFVRCIFESLALRYRQVVEQLKSMSPHPIEVLHIIGGGSRNATLNQFTANSIGIPVIAGPAECTALGNVMVQAGLDRHCLASVAATTTYYPSKKDKELWDKEYETLKHITL